MKTAKLIKIVDSSQALQILYKLDPPIQGYDSQLHQYVILSSAELWPYPVETYIFPSNEHGTEIAYDELSGSMKGETNHVLVLKCAGYVLEKPENV